jgi:hypothetical protein
MSNLDDEQSLQLISNSNDFFTTGLYDASAVRWRFEPLLPRINDPLHRPFSSRTFDPPGVPYAYRPPSAAAYVASGANFFAPFPSGLALFTSSPVGGVAQSRCWSVIEIGDVTAMSVDFIAGAYLTGTADHGVTWNLQAASMAIGLAPVGVSQSLISSGQGGGSASSLDPAFYCPAHSVVQALTYPLADRSSQRSAGTIANLTFSGYDLGPYRPNTGMGQTGWGGNCTILPCTEPGVLCQGPLRADANDQVRLPTEPSLINHELLYGLNKIGATAQLGYVPPRWGLWNPQLNVSTYMPLDLICRVISNIIQLPSLPYSPPGTVVTGAQMKQPPPSGLLQCVGFFTVQILWQTTQFSAGMLTGIGASHIQGVALILDALYNGTCSCAGAEVSLSSLSFPSLSCSANV